MKEQERPAGADTAPTEGLVRATLVALLLFIADAFLLNLGIIAVFTVPVIVLWILPGAYAVRHDRHLLRIRLLKAAVFSLMVVGVISANRFNNQLAKSRGEALVAAIDAYRSNHGRYPAALEDLVPDQLPAIPRAKYVWLFNRFSLMPPGAGNGSTAPVLYYFDLPPFGRQGYDFATRGWRFLE